MAEFLSPSWFDELAERLGRLGPAPSGAGSLALGQVVTDAPGGEVAWTLLFGEGLQTTLERGLERAEVVLTVDFETARALADGAATADLLYAGKITVRGDVGALLRGAALLASLGAALGEAG